MLSGINNIYNYLYVLRKVLESDMNADENTPVGQILEDLFAEVGMLKAEAKHSIEVYKEDSDNLINQVATLQSQLNEYRDNFYQVLDSVSDLERQNEKLRSFTIDSDDVGHLSLMFRGKVSRKIPLIKVIRKESALIEFPDDNRLVDLVGLKEAKEFIELCMDEPNVWHSLKGYLFTRAQVNKIGKRLAEADSILVYAKLDNV
jgi:hypothetical protein